MYTGMFIILQHTGESWFSPLNAISYRIGMHEGLYGLNSTQMKRLSQWCLLILGVIPCHLNLKFTVFTDHKILPKYLQQVRNFALEILAWHLRDTWLPKCCQRAEVLMSTVGIRRFGSGSGPAYKCTAVLVETDPWDWLQRLNYLSSLLTETQVMSFFFFLS